MGRVVAVLVIALLGPPAAAALNAGQLAVIINDADPASVEIGTYFASQRGLPAENVIHTRFAPGKPILSSAVFKQIYAEVQARTPDAVQAYALTWANPIRVNCMSITTAFAMGYATRHCAKGCRAIAPNPYFDSASNAPYRDFGIRPTMSIAARTVDNAKLLIDRGVLADGTKPAATAYFVVTPDKARNARAPAFALAQQRFAAVLPIRIERTRGIRDKFDIMFYFTGTPRVPFLETVGFLPGAIADHLTSAGGRLLKSPQMSALAWLEAGATGSYGTVVEPCNFPQKFPNPVVAMAHYLAGETLIEAYWKSVVWPGQGIFVGEPLARPYAQHSDSANPDAGPPDDG